MTMATSRMRDATALFLIVGEPCLTGDHVAAIFGGRHRWRSAHLPRLHKTARDRICQVNFDGLKESRNAGHGSAIHSWFKSHGYRKPNAEVLDAGGGGTSCHPVRSSD